MCHISNTLQDRGNTFAEGFTAFESLHTFLALKIIKKKNNPHTE